MMLIILMPNPQWIAEGPPLKEIVLKTLGKPKSGRTAIVIPAHNEPEQMLAHLSALEKQSTADFDVIAVLSPGFPAEKIAGRRPYGLILLLLKEPLGAAGYYAGEKFALSKTYRTIILADSDAMPLSRMLVERLSEAASSCDDSAFFPYMRRPDSDPKRSGSIHWYGAMNRTVLERSGLTFVPLFFGGVDEELEQRIISSGSRIADVPDLLMDHPLSKYVSLDSGVARTLFDLRNRGKMLYNRHSWSRTPIFYSLNWMSFLDRPDRASRRLEMGLRAMWDLVRADFSVNYWSLDSLDFQYKEVTLSEALSSSKNIVVVGRDREKDSVPGCARFECAMFESLKPSDHFLGLIPIAARCDTMILSVQWSHRFCLPSLLAPNVYMRIGERMYVIQQERHALVRYARFILSSALLVFLGGFYLTLSFFSWLRLRKVSDGYGR